MKKPATQKQQWALAKTKQYTQKKKKMCALSSKDEEKRSQEDKAFLGSNALLFYFLLQKKNWAPSPVTTTKGKWESWISTLVKFF